MLNQLPGVGAKTTGKLKSANIVSFKDVMKADLDVLERAAGRKAPFGDDLKFAVARVLNTAFSVDAVVDTESKEVTCTISNFDLKALTESNRSGCGVYFHRLNREVEREASVKPKYTLAVFTDHPGGILMWRENVKDVGTHTVKCLKKWGKITIRLVSTFMGMDVQTVIEGGPCPYVSPQDVYNSEIANIFASPNKRLKIVRSSQKVPKKAESPPAELLAELEANVAKEKEIEDGGGGGDGWEGKENQVPLMTTMEERERATVAGSNFRKVRSWNPGAEGSGGGVGGGSREGGGEDFRQTQIDSSSHSKHRQSSIYSAVTKESPEEKIGWQVRRKRTRLKNDTHLKQINTRRRTARRSFKPPP